MKVKLIRLLLERSFYEKHRNLLIPEIFPDILNYFLDALVFAHDRYKRTITVDELGQIIVLRNPMLTQAQKDLLGDVLNRVAHEGQIGEDVASDVLKAVWREEIGRRISKAGLDLIEGKGSLDDIKQSVTKLSESSVEEEDIQETPTGVTEVLEAMDKRVAWKFNIPSLHEKVAGISAGEFAVVFARVETGKTAFVVSLTASPGGFLSQGAKVLYLGNEEPTIRTMMRFMSAASGMTRDEIKKDPDKCAAEWDKIRRNLCVIDDVTMTLDRLNALVKKKKPDIIIADQLDKVKITGSFMRTDQELGAVYAGYREICKIHNAAGIGLTQASNDAEGRTVLHLNMMAESKTSKPAEADLIIGVGKVQEPLDDPARTLSLPKNKLSGYHGTVHTIIRPEISRFVA